MKKYLLILLLTPMFAYSQAGLVETKLGADSARMGELLLKEKVGDTLRMNVDTLSLTARDVRVFDSLRIARELRNVIVKDASTANAGVVDSLIGTDEKIYNLKYIVDDGYSMVGYVNFGNNAVDTLTRITLDTYGVSGVIRSGSRLTRISILSYKVGSTIVEVDAFTVPITDNDSLLIAAKIVRQGGNYYLSVNKYDVPTIAPISPSATGGTNILYEQISSTLFPTVGSSIQLKLRFIWAVRRF